MLTVVWLIGGVLFLILFFVVLSMYGSVRRQEKMMKYQFQIWLAEKELITPLFLRILQRDRILSAKEVTEMTLSNPD